MPKITADHFSNILSELTSIFCPSLSEESQKPHEIHVNLAYGALAHGFADTDRALLPRERHQITQLIDRSSTDIAIPFAITDFRDVKANNLPSATDHLSKQTESLL